MSNDEYSKLEVWLNTRLHAARKNAIMSAIHILDGYGDLTAWADISAYLENDTREDTTISSTLDIIEGLLMQNLNNILAIHDVTFNGDMTECCDVLEGILRIQNYDDNQRLVDIIESHSDSGEIFCELLAEVLARPSDDFIIHLVHVGRALIDKLLDEIRPTSSLESIHDDLPPLDETKKEKIRRFIETHPESLARRAIKEDCTPIGLPLKFLIQTYKNQLIQLEPDAPDVAAMEFMGLALISEAMLGDLLIVCRGQNELVYHDNGFIMKVDIGFTKYLAEINQL